MVAGRAISPGAEPRYTSGHMRGNMTRVALAVALCCLVACSEIGAGPQSSGGGGDADVGDFVDIADPEPEGDPCLEDDICPEGSGGSGGSGGAGGQGGGGSAPGPTNKYAPGALLLVLKYAPRRKKPDQKASGWGAVHTNGGVHGGHPKGTVPPGQHVTMLDEPRSNGFYKVQYGSNEGWLHGNKLAATDPTIHPAKFARASAVRNAFFMHQIKRARWNKDGPYGSANCAPTSLAMAAKIFGFDKPRRTIERSIHGARDSYGAPADESDGTSRKEIVAGAKKLGFDVNELGSNLATSDAEMDRLDKQLGWNRVVVLEGKPGKQYRDRMTQAYTAAGLSSSYYYTGTHSILAVALLDSGKYLVADPLSEVGMVTMSRKQLKSFITQWGGTGTAVYIKNWKP